MRVLQSTYLRLVLALALVGALAIAPAALADHDGPGGKGTDGPHEDAPTNVPVIDDVKVVCTVSGGVTYPNPDHGVTDHDTQPNHNHFQFVGVEIDCLPVNPLNSDHVNLAGTYEVEATGGTDGHFADPMMPIDHPHNPHHGEDCESGWSHSSGYPGSDADAEKPKDDSNKAFITASGPKDVEGYVKFVRIGTNVTAWGALADPDADPAKKDTVVNFVFDGEFVPTEDSDGNDDLATIMQEACVEGNTKIVEASLTGVAEVGNAEVKAE